eukprot:PITA_13578
MLHDQSLPLHLWVEACNTAVYLQNRSLHRILGKKTPMEAYFGKRPDVSHFRNFGSSVYCHVTKDARKKLHPTTELGILKSMQVSLERELKFHADEEPSVPKEEEPQIDAEQPHAEDLGVETSTHANTSRDGENAQGKLTDTEPSSFKEAVQQSVWVDAMVEEYDSIIRNSVWDVVPRPQGKSVVSSIWLYKVKQVADGSVEKHKARLLPEVSHRSRGLTTMRLLLP